VYLELTTLRQDLVTRKNRKLRLFRERYPDKTVHLLYRRDLEGILGRPALDRMRPAFHLLRA
jgi:hypoxanthine phosphoribosyltransferase